MGQLIQVATTTVSSAVSDVQMTGIDTDDVYMLTGTNITIATNTAYLQTRVVKDVSGTPTTQSASNYKVAAKNFRGNTSFQNYSNSGTPRTEMYWSGAQPISNDVSGETNACLMYLYNFNSSSEYSFVSVNDLTIESGATALNGNNGGFAYAVAEAHNGISISGYATTITGGTFTLYKVI